MLVDIQPIDEEFDGDIGTSIHSAVDNQIENLISVLMNVHAWNSNTITR